MQRTSRVVLVASIMILAGCHADVTERVVINPDRTVSVTYREAIDHELLTDIHQLGGEDPFRLAPAQAAGWAVSSAADGDHYVVTYSKTAAVNQLATLTLLHDEKRGADPGDSVFDFSPRRRSTFPSRSRTFYRRRQSPRYCSHEPATLF